MAPGASVTKCCQFSAFEQGEYFHLCSIPLYSSKECKVCSQELHKTGNNSFQFKRVSMYVNAYILGCGRPLLKVLMVNSNFGSEPTCTLKVFLRISHFPEKKQKVRWENCKGGWEEYVEVFCAFLPTIENKEFDCLFWNFSHKYNWKINLVVHCDWDQRNHNIVVLLQFF